MPRRSRVRLQGHFPLQGLRDFVQHRFHVQVQRGAFVVGQEFSGQPEAERLLPADVHWRQGLPSVRWWGMVAQVYRPRKPRASPLWQCLTRHFDTFQAVYEERYQSHHGFLRPIIAEVVHKFMACGDLERGFARDNCRLPIADCRFRKLHLRSNLQSTFINHQLFPGIVMAIHTFGEYLDFHPHLHLLMADGLFLRDERFLVLPENGMDAVEELFRAKSNC